VSSKKNRGKQISRRQAIEVLGAVGVVSVIDCGGGVASSATTGSGSGSGSGSATCVLTPELTVGPYFVDEKLNRSDLTINTTDANVLSGTPLGLTLTLEQYSSSGCSPLQGAQVDIWHADAAGIYSDESSEGTSGQTFLRGYQITNSRGVVSFKTIFPGWYTGRTIHIHVMIRTFTASGTVAFEFTTQLFFDQTLINGVTTTVSPYSSRGLPDTTNAQDNIYNSATQLTLATATSGSGYTAAATLGVQIA
jgi:protocatechuate 3,4-dioxygenase beta subunit